MKHSLVAPIFQTHLGIKRLNIIEPRGYQTIMHTILGGAVKSVCNPKLDAETHRFFSDLKRHGHQNQLCPERLLRNSQLYQKQQATEGGPSCSVICPCSFSEASGKNGKIVEFFFE